MFDRFTTSKKRPSGKRALAIGSVLIHLGIGGALIAMGFWEISEIGRPNRGVAMASTTFQSKGGDGEQKAAKRVEQKKKVVKETRQPSDRPDEEIETGGEATTTGTDGDGGDPDATGDGPPGVGSVGELCLDLSRCTGTEPGIPTVKEPTPEVKLLPPTVLSELRRVAGDPQIQPPTSTQNAMRHANEKRTVAVVKMCLDRRGGVDRASIVKSSDHAEYDAKLLSNIRRWRYQPYRAGGVAIAICTHVTFIYQQD